MLLSAVFVLVVAESSSEIPEGLMNNPVLCALWDQLITVAFENLPVYRSQQCDAT